MKKCLKCSERCHWAALAAAQARIAAAEIYTAELEAMLQRGCAAIWDLQVTKGTVDAWEKAEREAEAWVEDVKRAALGGKPT